MAKKKNRGGWPKRERVPVLLGVAPDVAEWFAEISLGGLASRKGMMEAWLAVLPAAVREVDDLLAGRSESLHPEDAADVLDDFGRRLALKAFEFGVMRPVITSALEYEREMERERKGR